MSFEAKGETSASWRGGVVVPAERGMRETSIKVDCILVEVVLEVGVDKVVVEKKMRLSRETFEDFLVFLAQTWRLVLEA